MNFELDYSLGTCHCSLRCQTTAKHTRFDVNCYSKP